MYSLTGWGRFWLAAHSVLFDKSRTFRPLYVAGTAGTVDDRYRPRWHVIGDYESGLTSTGHRCCRDVYMPEVDSFVSVTAAAVQVHEYRSKV